MLTISARRPLTRSQPTAHDRGEDRLAPSPRSFVAQIPGTNMAMRGGMACPRERAAYIFVEAPGGPDVPDICACARRARQLGPARASLRPVRPIRRFGRGWP